MSRVDKVALAGGDVPLPDAGVRGPRVDVAVVHGDAGDVRGVAPGSHIKSVSCISFEKVTSMYFDYHSF